MGKARVTAEISLFDAIAAIEHFAEDIPEDRCSRFVSDRIEAAAKKIADKADAARDKNIAEAAAQMRAGATADATIAFLRSKLTPQRVTTLTPGLVCSTVYGGISGLFDSSRPNQANTPQAEVTFCRTCLSWHEAGRSCYRSQPCGTSCNHPQCDTCNPVARWVEADEQVTNNQ